MATNLPTGNVEPDTIAHFDRVAAQIERTFDQLIEQLIGRKETLLLKVIQLREDFHNKESGRREAIQELEKTQEHMRQLSLKANVNIPIHQQASQAYEKGMEQLTTPTELPPLVFSCPARGRLVKLIETFGELCERINYLDKKHPILTAGKEAKGVGDFDGAIGIALDECNKIIYIADLGNSRIQMFSFQAEFIAKFGEDVLKNPWGITVTEDHIFITDVSLHSLLRYDKKTLQFIDRVGGEGSGLGKLNGPHGLAVDTNEDNYIADSNNNRVCIFSKQFQFQSCIGLGKVFLPHDIKLTRESVVVLDWNVTCVHFFSRNGDLLSSFVTRGDEQECTVYFPFFFDLDANNNIIISDNENHNIKILSSSGDLIHLIGSEGKGRGEFINPEGVAISDTGTIYSVSKNPDYVLQIYQ